MPEILKARIAILVLINPLEGIPIYLARAAALPESARIVAASAITYLCLRLAIPVGKMIINGALQSFPGWR